MSLLIDLYSDRKILNQRNKDIALLRTKKCDVLEDLSYYKDEIATTLDEDFHIKSVISSMEKERSYQEVFGRISDSHNEIEKLGVCKYGKRYTTIISLEDSLDYILHRLSKAKVDNIRQVDNYDILSRCLLKLNYDGLFGFTVGNLLGLDDNLDNFIVSLMDKVKEGENLASGFLSLFIRNLLSEVGSVAEYLALHFNSNMDRGTSVIRSKSFCSFVLTTDEKCDGEIMIRSEGFEDYKVKVRSFEKKEYASCVDLKYAE